MLTIGMTYQVNPNNTYYPTPSNNIRIWRQTVKFHTERYCSSHKLPSKQFNHTVDLTQIRTEWRLNNITHHNSHRTQRPLSLQRIRLNRTLVYSHISSSSGFLLNNNNGCLHPSNTLHRNNSFNNKDIRPKHKLTILINRSRIPNNRRISSKWILGQHRKLQFRCNHLNTRFTMCIVLF